MKDVKNKSVRKNLGDLMKECSRGKFIIEVHVLITEEMAEQIAELAGDAHNSQSDAVRYILQQGLNHLKQK